MSARATLARWVGVLPAAVLAISVVDGCSVSSTAAGLPSAFGESDGGSSGSSGGSSSSGSGGSGGSFVDSASCVPGDVATWHAPAYRSAVPPRDACPRAGTDLVAAFYDACVGPSATTQTCAAFKSANPDCYACILSPDTADHYGPLLDHGAFVTANVAGCIELSETGPTALACAQAVQAVSGCELASCEVNCPVTDANSLASYDACTSTADLNGCQTFESAASCVNALLDGGVGGGDAGGPRLSDCLAPAFKDFYDSVVPHFCSAASAPAYDAGSGTPPGDAGAD